MTKFRTWADSLPIQSKEEIWNGVKEAGVNEARFARDDIRQKLIEEGWTGKAQTDKARFYEPTSSDSTQETEYSGNIYSTIEPEEFKGTVWDNETFQEMGDSGIDAPDIEAPEVQEPDIDEPEIDP